MIHHRRRYAQSGPPEWAIFVYMFLGAILVVWAVLVVWVIFTLFA